MKVLSNDSCRACGACCASPVASEVYVTLTEFDMQRVARKDFVDKRRLLTRSVDGRCVCVALLGLVGTTTACAVYETRPMVCRMVEPNSMECLAARKREQVNDG